MRVNGKAFEFEWDRGNIGKNYKSHDVTEKETEEVFFDGDKREYPDPKHSIKEVRKVVAGRTKSGRLLIVIYTIRGGLIRIISARDLNKRREGDLYEKAT